MIISPPCLLDNTHQLDGFNSGQNELDTWLTRYALQNLKANAARTFVVCQKKQVVGYYSLAVGSVEYEMASRRVQKGLARHPIPVMVLARLAVDRPFQGRGIGSGLLKDAVARTLRAAAHAGIRAMIVHAKDDDAKRFYCQYGFEASPFDPLLLMLLLKDAEMTLRQAPAVRD